MSFLNSKPFFLTGRKKSFKQLTSSSVLQKMIRFEIDWFLLHPRDNSLGGCR